MYLFASNHTFSSAYFQADFFGKLIFLALFALSILCWIVIITKLIQMRKTKLGAKILSASFEKQAQSLLQFSPDKRYHDHPFSHIFCDVKQKTMEILNKNHFFAEDKEQVHLTRNDLELVESHVLTRISKEAKTLEHNLFLLSMITKLAPFLGLLGTVWGILLTFSQLQAGATSSSNTVILGGLSTALVTTVLGLIIAIPSLIGYSYLRNLFTHLRSEMDDLLYKLLSMVEMQYRKP